MKKIVTIGGATQDIFICHNNPHMISLQTFHGEQSFLALQEGCKIDIERLDYRTGGGATNSAVSFARLGFDVSCCIKIGTDPQGDDVCRELSTLGIKALCTYGKKKTGISFIIPTKSKDRLVLVWRGANTELTFSEIDQQVIKSNNTL